MFDPDTHLLQRHVEGDTEAFAELMRNFSTPIYGYLSRCGLAESDRDDLFQEIFLRVHKAAPSHRPDRPLRAWIFTIAVNTVRSYFRSKKVHSAVVLSPTSGVDAAVDPNQLSLAENRETAKWLDAEVAQLPLPEREVLILCCVQQLPQKEVAEALGIPVNTVKTQLRRARLRLARKLAGRRMTIEREGSR